MKKIHLRLMAVLVSAALFTAASALASPQAKPQAAQPTAPATAALCLSCHDQPLESPSGPVQDIKARMASNANLHGPLKQQNCVGCHRPVLRFGPPRHQSATCCSGVLSSLPAA